MDGGWFTDGSPNFVSTKKLLAVLDVEEADGLERLFEEEVWSAEKIEDAIKECTKALELNPTYMKALTRRAEAHEKLEHFEELLQVRLDPKSVHFILQCLSCILLIPNSLFIIYLDRYKKILELDPSNSQARRAIPRLEQLAKEKQEKLKEEMIGKHKECFY
ncbi:hypothetical protein CK203_040936 [Vitis vinifera]|uniref:Uncharacterized protein n=1 Tax=Vitis vinifera TaxID=29760 RepID=A0A438HVA2_VITVI|nr:hypothetical protein CK203_040936 [Vitis vinifera]